MVNKVALILILTSFAQGCHRWSDQTVPIIGLNQKGQVEKFYVNQEKFFRSTGNMIGNVKDKTLAELDLKVSTAQVSNDANPPWRIRRVIIGFGIEASLGFMLAGVNVESFVELRISPKGSGDSGI